MIDLNTISTKPFSGAPNKSARQWHAYRHIPFNNCDQPSWHIVPADKRWFRNYYVANILTEHLEKHNLKYPTT